MPDIYINYIQGSFVFIAVLYYTSSLDPVTLIFWNFKEGYCIIFSVEILL